MTGFTLFNYALCYLCILFSSPYLSSLFLLSFKYKTCLKVRTLHQISQLCHTSPISLPDCQSQEDGKDAAAISALLPFNLGSF